MSSKAATYSGRTRPPRQMPPCHRCGGHVQTRRVVDYLVISCTSCGHRKNHHEPDLPVNQKTCGIFGQVSEFSGDARPFLL